MDKRETEVVYLGQSFVVIKGNRPSLMGRHLLTEIRLDWASIFNSMEEVNSIQDMIIN